MCSREENGRTWKKGKQSPLGERGKKKVCPSFSKGKSCDAKGRATGSWAAYLKKKEFSKKEMSCGELTKRVISFEERRIICRRRRRHPL